MSKDQISSDAERQGGWGKDDKRNSVDWSKVAKARLKKLRNKVYRCPVHRKEKFVGLMKWSLHRRWCRAGAGATRRQEIAARRAERMGANVAHEAAHALDTGGIQFDVHRSTLVLRNGKSEIVVASFVHGSNLAKLGRTLRQLVRTGLQEEALAK